MWYLTVISIELPVQTARGHQQDTGEGEQQREIHQQAAGASDPGVPHHSCQTQWGRMLDWQTSRHCNSFCLVIQFRQSEPCCCPPGKGALPAGQWRRDGKETVPEKGQWRRALTSSYPCQISASLIVARWKFNHVYPQWFQSTHHELCLHGTFNFG